MPGTPFGVDWLSLQVMLPLQGADAPGCLVRCGADEAEKKRGRVQRQSHRVSVHCDQGAAGPGILGSKVKVGRKEP